MGLSRAVLVRPTARHRRTRPRQAHPDHRVLRRAGAPGRPRPGGHAHLGGDAEPQPAELRVPAATPRGNGPRPARPRATAWSTRQGPWSRRSAPARTSPSVNGCTRRSSTWRFTTRSPAWANRALFLKRLAHAVAVQHRCATASAVLFMDLDARKAGNDSRGHSAGRWRLHPAAGRARCPRPRRPGSPPRAATGGRLR